MSDKRAKKIGRPSKFTQALADEMCERLSKGEPLAVICRDEHMPSARAVYDWMEKDPSLSAAFARARVVGFDAIATECIEIAEDGSRDYVTKRNDNGSTYEAFDSEHVQRSKLRIETRLKLLAKWDPKRYGERQEVEHTGGVTLVMQSLDEQL